MNVEEHIRFDFENGFISREVAIRLQEQIGHEGRSVDNAGGWRIGCRLGDGLGYDLPGADVDGIGHLSNLFRFPPL